MIFLQKWMVNHLFLVQKRSHMFVCFRRMFALLNIIMRLFKFNFSYDFDDKKIFGFQTDVQDVVVFKSIECIISLFCQSNISLYFCFNMMNRTDLLGVTICWKFQSTRG